MIYKDLDNFIPVISASGACGKFISAMVTFSLNDVHISGNEYKNGIDYHSAWDFIMNETNFAPHEVIPHPQWKSLKLKKDSSYHGLSFAGGVTLVEFDEISKFFPGFKIIMITVNQDDRILVDLNHFWKSGPKNYVQENSEFKNINFDDIPSINPETAKKVIEDHYKTGIDTFHTVLEDLASDWFEKLKPEWQERIHFIKFRDIVDNPETVISTIERVVEKSMTENLRTEYYRYVNLQLRYYKEFIPWHPSLLQTS